MLYRRYSSIDTFRPYLRVRPDPAPSAIKGTAQARGVPLPVQTCQQASTGAAHNRSA